MLKQLTKIGIIMLIVSAIVILILTIFSQFNIDTANDNDLFGIYDSTLSGRLSFYNPLLESIWLTQSIALITLPIILKIYHKMLKVDVLPWVVVSLLSIVGLVVSPIYRPSNFQQTISSILPKFFVNELYVIASVVVGYLFLEVYRGRFKTRKASRHRQHS